MYSNEKKSFPGITTFIEPYLFNENSSDLNNYKTPKLLAGQPPQPQQQPTLLRQYWNKLHWRHKIQAALPLISALTKGLFDYSSAIRQHGIYNAGRSGLAGFFEGLALGIIADVGIESIYQLYKHGKDKHWW